jgi:acetylornithine deacetylase/succinyl-diaminopimelate desuccinylase-like protein
MFMTSSRMLARMTADPIRERVAGHEADVLDLLGRLVAEESVEGSRAIAACLDIVADRLDGVAASLDRLDLDGVPALVARIGGGDHAGRLTFSGHVDVVPAAGGWSSPPYELTARDGHLYGRGTCDMKAGVAAAVEAARVIAGLGLLSGVSIELAFTGDEEVGSERGTRALLAAGRITGRAAVCCEPTGLDVFLGNRGLVWMDVVVTGRGGHAGMAHALANPIDAAATLIGALGAIPLTARDDRFDPGEPTLTVTRMQADGGGRNVVPDRIELGLDRRLLPGEDAGAVIAEIERAVGAAVRPPFAAEAVVSRRWPPYAIDADRPVARAAAGAVRASGREPAFGMDSAANDSSWLHAAGIDTVLLGPGDPPQAHATDEHVDAAEVVAAVEIYARLMAATASAVV